MHGGPDGHRQPRLGRREVSHPLARLADGGGSSCYSSPLPAARLDGLPISLEELAGRTAHGEDFSFLLGDFLDGFYRRPAPGALAAEPRLLADRQPDGAVQDAFLAATAHALANIQGWPGPRWAFEEARYLRHPFFPIRAAAFRATLLLESPMPFRRRNLFVTANALSGA